MLIVLILILIFLFVYGGAPNVYKIECPFFSNFKENRASLKMVRYKVIGPVNEKIPDNIIIDPPTEKLMSYWDLSKNFIVPGDFPNCELWYTGKPNYTIFDIKNHRKYMIKTNDVKEIVKIVPPASYYMFCTERPSLKVSTIIHPICYLVDDFNICKKLVIAQEIPKGIEVYSRKKIDIREIADEFKLQGKSYSIRLKLRNSKAINITNNAIIYCEFNILIGVSGKDGIKYKINLMPGTITYIPVIYNLRSIESSTINELVFLSVIY